MEDLYAEVMGGADWIAIVRVPRCAPSIAAKRAEAAIRLSLAAQTLLLEETKGSGLRLAHDPFTPARKNSLVSTGAGPIRQLGSWKFGGAHATEEWYQSLQQNPDAKPVTAALNGIVEQLLLGHAIPFALQITSRALSWYADAVQDTNYETRSIKFATAIESLVLPERGLATATFVIRGALLAQRQDSPMSHWAAIAHKLYKHRSAIAHGDITGLLSNRAASDAMQLTRHTILQLLAFCSQVQPIGTATLGSKTDVLNLYERLEHSFQSEIGELVKAYRFDKWKI